MKLLPISIVSFGLAWDYFNDADQLGQAITNFEKLKLDATEMKSAKSRKNVLGFVFMIAGVVNTIISFESVEVISNHNSIGLSYKF